jgi:hypothetical protein
MNSATTNTVKMVKGSKTVSLRITKHEDGRVTGEVSRSIVWKPIGGLRATRNEMARLEAEGFKPVAAA